MFHLVPEMQLILSSMMFCVFPALVSPVFFNLTWSPPSTIPAWVTCSPLRAPRQTNGFQSLGEQIFYVSIIANLNPIFIKRTWLQSYIRPLFLQSECSLFFFVGREGGEYLLPIRCWSIRRRSSLLTCPFSDPSICLLRGSSQQSVCCFCFIFFFRHLAAPAQRYRGGFTLGEQGGVQGLYWWLLGGRISPDTRLLETNLRHKGFRMGCCAKMTSMASNIWLYSDLFLQRIVLCDYSGTQLSRNKLFARYLALFEPT